MFYVAHLKQEVRVMSRFNNVLALIMLAFGLLCTANTVAAQGPPRPERPSNSSAMEQFNTDSFMLDTDSERSSEAYFSARKFADCVRGISEERVIGVLAAYPGSGDEIRRLQAVSQRFRGCAASNSSVPSSYIRGAMAESLLNTDNYKQVIANANNTSIALTAYPRGEGKETMQVKTLRAVFRCLAFASPPMAANVLAKPAGSEIEKKSLNFLFSSSPNCAGASYPKGMSVQLQRAILAESLYNWAQEAKAG